MSESVAKKKKKKRSPIRRIVILGIIFAFIGLIGYNVYRNLKKEYQVVYDAYTASVGTISNALSFSGTLNLIDSKTYTATADATVRGVYAGVGDRINKNQRLVRLSDGTTVTADFSGTVNVLEIKKDDEIYTGDTLVQIADFDHMKVTMRIDEYDITDVAVGQECVITVTATEQQINSTIATINFISTATYNVAYYTATAYVDVPEGMQIYPGMQVTVRIPKEEAKDVVILKTDALTFDRQNNAFVYKQTSDGSFEKVSVEVGVSNGNYCEIRKGVENGETVYVEGKAEETGNSIFSGMFGTQVNQPNMRSQNRGNWNNGRSGNGSSRGGTGNIPGGGMPGGGMR
ncbi:MAG: HlyD family efflux transporter periplasmic adaptor subunit [Lachnospiraceae bacterium]|nr:HlyD family efflux transporter periplasmic adaptor subunit [Lachnospiraceae bacterium]